MEPVFVGRAEAAYGCDTSAGYQFHVKPCGLGRLKVRFAGHTFEGLSCKPLGASPMPLSDTGQAMAWLVRKRLDSRVVNDQLQAETMQRATCRSIGRAPK